MSLSLQLRTCEDKHRFYTEAPNLFESANLLGWPFLVVIFKDFATVAFVFFLSYSTYLHLNTILCAMDTIYSNKEYTFMKTKCVNTAIHD